jgi:hypothetical protein
MALSLKESRAVADMAQLLYDFLPGSGNPRWKGHVSFKTVAEQVGVGGFWQSGSKTPMITALLEKTLEYRRDHFEQLILGIVRAGLTYRGKDRPIQPSEIERLNGYLLDVGFKFPALWDPIFVGSLGLDSSERAKKRVDEAIAERQSRAAAQSSLSTDLRLIRDEFFGLHNEPSPQEAGRKFEKILNRIFAIHGLAPREPFRVVGEQIDGSFDLDHETYLVEAKWEKDPVSEAPLVVFREKISGKSQFSRGVFISLNGITEGAQDAITRGKQPNFFVVDGYDLTIVLSEQIALLELLRQKRRLLAEEGKVVVPFSQLRGVAHSPPWNGSGPRA